MLKMPWTEYFTLAGFTVAVATMLLVTQTKERVSWPAWLVPAVVIIPFTAWTVLAITKEGFIGFWPVLMNSYLGGADLVRPPHKRDCRILPPTEPRAGSRHEIRGVGDHCHLHGQHRSSSHVGADDLPRA